jgi:AraC family transcriptional regulator of adaptative response / DNA-3-methyladenine glycosylase II
MQLVSRVRKQFDLDANPAMIETHLRADPLLAKKLGAKSGMRVTGAFDMFETAVRAVLGQQISVAGASTLTGRLVQKFGEAMHTPVSGVTHQFPQAGTLANLDSTVIGAIGLPAKRAETIRNLAQFFLQGEFNLKAGASLDEAIMHLKAVPGIGEWTAQYIALRALGFPDAFPAGDLGLQKAAADDYPSSTASSARLTEHQLALRASTWSPWRGYAAFILWTSQDKK